MGSKKIGKISPIPRTFFDKGSLGGSLSTSGYNRFPTTTLQILPYKELSGEYRTGLDENAKYIKDMQKLNPEAAEEEIAKVREARKRLEETLGIDLGPRSDYYSKIYAENTDNVPRASIVKLKADGDNFFDLDDPLQEVMWHWVRVYPTIAPSYDAWKSGRVKNSRECKFYVNNPEFESEITYNKKVEENRAIATLSDMSDSRRLKVAKLLGLKVSFASKPTFVYNELDKFIKDAGSKFNNVELFNRVCAIPDDQLETQYLVEEALHLGVYRTGKGGRIYEGAEEIAKSKDALLDELYNPKFQDVLLALKEKVDMKKQMEI